MVLLVNRNTARERAAWLVHPVVDDVLCEAAEAFVTVLERRRPVDGWRGGALASLRSLVPGAVHEARERWPGDAGASPLALRFWLDDQEVVPRRGPRLLSPVRAELARRLAGRDRLDVALSALIGNSRSHLQQLVVWGCDYGEPRSTERLCADLLAAGRAAGTLAPGEPGQR